MSVDSFEKLRPVGRLERYSTARHDLKFYINAAVTAWYTLPDTCSLPLKNYIYQACKAAIEQHPVLSAIPADENTQDPYFARIPQIDLEKCVFFQNRVQGLDREHTEDDGLAELLKSQHNSSFTPPNPFWRLTIVTNDSQPYHFAAAFVFHHALGDGESGKAFHRTFQHGLTRTLTAATQDCATVIASPNNPLFPNIEALHSLPVSILHILRILFREKIWASRDPGLWTGAPITTTLSTEIRHFAFSASDTNVLVKACREHDTTVTAALQTLIAGALFTQLPANFTQLRCGGALSTRRFLSPLIINDNSMGVFVQDYSEEYTRDNFMTERWSWAEAKRSRETIKQVLALEGKNCGPGLLRYVKDFQQELFLSKVGKERTSTYEVSNLGIFKSTEQVMDVKIGQMVFTQSANVAGNAFQVSTITGADGRLTIGVSWQKGVVKDEIIDEVLKTVKEEVKLLGQKA